MAAAPRSNVLVIFPGALGDFLCFLPTLLALHAQNAAVTVVAKPSLLELLQLSRLRTISIDRREIADLFANDSLAMATRALLAGHHRTYTWSGWGNDQVEQRLAAATGGSVETFPFRGMRNDEHASDYYARCAGVSPLPAEPRVLRFDDTWLAAFRRQHGIEARTYVVVHPGSGSAAKNWCGFGELVESWERRRDDAVVVVRGPAELERGISAVPGIVVDAPSLPQLAALLRGARVYMGNDSGVSHLAAAVGARGIVLFGPSNPAVWAPRSRGLRVVRALGGECAQCSPEVFCSHRLPLRTVLDALASTPVLSHELV